MNNAIKIKDNIYWIGVNDRRTHIFENYWPLPKGVAYNSYVIADEKVVVIDTVERSRMDDYLDSLQAVLQGRKVDYLIINHMEPDHTGAIKNLLCHYPDLTVVGNCKTFPMLQNYYGVDSNLLEVKEGDSLNIEFLYGSDVALARNHGYLSTGREYRIQRGCVRSFRNPGRWYFR